MCTTTTINKVCEGRNMWDLRNHHLVRIVKVYVALTVVRIQCKVQLEAVAQGRQTFAGQ